MVDKKKHKNDEETKICPVEGCNAEPLARAVHLHVMQSAGDGHGEQGEIPEDVDLDEAEKAGTREVEMEYPEERDSEQVARLCPYCDRPFRGKHGVMIHLGQVAGRKDHPEDASERHNPEDLAIGRVDDNDNVVEIIEEGDQTAMPSTKRRRGDSLEKSMGDLDEESIKNYIEDLRERGLTEETERAEKMLLGK